MDIAHRLGLGAASQPATLVNFAIALTGLTDNPTYGPSALRGATVQAVTSGWEGAPPESLSYQWYAQGAGPIAGATAASFVPDAPLAPASVIFCVVAVPGQGSQSSAQVVFRDGPPQLDTAPFDPVEVFDLDTGPQVLAAGTGFLGQNLQFAVTGADAVIDPVTGDISIPTDVARDGDVVVVSATNSGGVASATFQVTVEDVAVEGALPFGALTPAGMGGVPVAGSAISQGDPGGHWEITGGMLVPTAAGEGALAGVYPLVLDTGVTLDVMIEDDRASARADEIATVYDALPLTARGLMVQDDDARAVGRIWLTPKVFLNEMVLEPTNWLEDADPRASVRPVTLAGLALGGSSDGVLRTENVTVQGFEFQMEAGGLLPAVMQTGTGNERESDGNIGIVLVERPSRHVTIRQNEVWSRDVEEIVIADDFRDNLKTSRQMRGISTKRGTAYSTGLNEGIKIEDNYLHDLSRGASVVGLSAYQDLRARFCGNIIEDCYTNFFTLGFSNGVDVFDNYCMGVYAANGDTLGAIPASSPHSACGGSFDAGGARSTRNISLRGNFFHTGWRRTKLHADLGLPKPAIGATGVKFNDPAAPDSYWNIDVQFNTVISHGICMELSGAGSDTHMDLCNNTLASENYAGVGSGPVFYFQGADNARFFNNIYTGVSFGAEDGTGMFSRTRDTLQGYGNLKINTSSDDPFGQNIYFSGDPVKGLDLLTIDEALAAYAPKPATAALLSGQKKGALGTGLYQGNGMHSVVYDKPRSDAGTAHVYPLTRWDGQSLSKTGNMANAPSASRYLTFAIKARNTVAQDTAQTILFGMTGQQAYFRNFNGSLLAKLETGGETLVQTRAGEQQLLSSEGMNSLLISCDFELGIVHIAQNGQLVEYIQTNVIKQGTFSFRASVNRIFADIFTSPSNQWRGDLGLLYISPEFVDCETVSGLNAFFSDADTGGQFVDFGTNGALPTGTAPLVYIAGTAAEITAIKNKGTGGVFNLQGGAITDVA